MSCLIRRESNIRFKRFRVPMEVCDGMRLVCGDCVTSIESAFELNICLRAV